MRSTLLQTAINILQMTIGATLGAVSFLIFLKPLTIPPAGITGVATILNHLIGSPIGIVILILNIPIMIIGARMLPGGWRVIPRTIYVLLVYSLAIELLAGHLPTDVVAADEKLLGAIFGGIVGGIGGGLVLRSGATFGGTSTIAMILRRRFGFSMSTTYVFTDIAILLTAGVVFGWEATLYGIVVLFLDGVAAEYIIDGPNVIRTAIIITESPRAVSDAIIQQMNRGVTKWTGTGMYTDQDRNVLYVTVGRSQIHELKDLVTGIDPSAFMVIGQGHVAYGEGFRPLPTKLKNGNASS